MWYFLDLQIGSKAQKGKNKVPQHDQWGLTILEINSNRKVVRYLHEDGGWFTIAEDISAPTRPMLYASLSGANKAFRGSIPPKGSRGDILFAVYTAPNCEDPRGKAALIARHLETKLVD